MGRFFHTVIVVSAIISCTSCGVTKAPAELDSVQAEPQAESIQPELLSDLQQELERVIAESGTAGPQRFLLAWEIEPLENASSISWAYPSASGDYDLNSLTNAADLVEIGRYFGISSGEPGWDKAQVLAIMKDSRIGSYGTIGMVLMLLAKAAAGLAAYFHIRLQALSAVSWPLSARIPWRHNSPSLDCQSDRPQTMLQKSYRTALPHWKKASPQQQERKRRGAPN